MKWKTLSKKQICKGKIFDYFSVERQSSQSQKVGNFDLVSFNDWVNVIAVTKENKFVLVKQFRHGIDEFTLEIPGGAVEIGEKPKVAGIRELEEETGYTCKDENVYFIGKVQPNPAFQDNYCYTYLMKDVEKTEIQKLDNFEEIEVFEVTEVELKEKIVSGEIAHSLVVAAFWYYENSKV